MAVTVGELTKKCLDAIGSKAELMSVPERQRPERSEVQALICDPSKAERLLGWRPQVSLENGLQRTSDYLRDHLREYRMKGYVI